MSSPAEVEETKSEDVGGVIDINDPRLAEQVDEFDPQADPNKYIPPPDGEYEVRIKMGEKGIYSKERIDSKTKKVVLTKAGKPELYLVLETVAEIVAPGERFDGFRLGSDFHNSIIMPGQSNSSLGHLMNMLGQPFTEGQNLQSMAHHVKTVFETEQRVGVQTEWQAYSKDVQDAFKAGDVINGKRNGVFKYGERNFKEILDDGKVVGHDPVVECPITGAEIPARPKIKSYRLLPEEPAKGEESGE